MNAEELKNRTKRFALEVVKVVESLPSSRAAGVMSQQLLRSGTSVAANYRAACRARSKPDFISKAGIAIEEADETLFWMELLVESKIVPSTNIEPLMRECNELIAILVSSVKTARANLARK